MNTNLLLKTIFEKQLQLVGELRGYIDNLSDNDSYGAYLASNEFGKEIDEIKKLIDQI